jgi:ATP-dependent protease La (LON) substrate-binding domain
LETVPTDRARAHGLTERLLSLVAERFESGLPSPILDGLLKLTGKDEAPESPSPSAAAASNIVEYLAKLDNPEQLADLVSCTLLPTPAQRQKILETLDLEERLKRLIRFLAMPAKKKA